jgi:hypothetical protein
LYIKRNKPTNKRPLRGFFFVLIDQIFIFRNKLLINFLFLFLAPSLFSQEISFENLKKVYNLSVILQADTYSPKEFEQGKILFSKLEGLNTLPPSEESANEYKLAISLLKKAGLNSITPKLSKERAVVLSSLEVAEDSFAESLSVEYFTHASDLYSEGDLLTAGMSQRLKEAWEEENPEKQSNLIDTILEDSENCLKKWEESILESSKATSLSLAQAEALKSAQSDLEDTIALLRKYRSPEKNDTVELTLLEKDIKEGMDTFSTGKVKTAFYKLEFCRKKLDDLVHDDFKVYSMKKIEDAKKKLELAEESLQKERRRFIEDPEILAQLEDNLRAAKETILISETLFQEDKYLDSIAKSEESLFLTDRFGEDISHASVPEKKLYDEDLEENPTAKQKEPKHFSGKDIPGVHVVKKGDSLVKISAFYYQKRKNWKEIYKFNRTKIKNPKLIFSGQKISLPQK